MRRDRPELGRSDIGLMVTCFILFTGASGSSHQVGASAQAEAYGWYSKTIAVLSVGSKTTYRSQSCGMSSILCCRKGWMVPRDFIPLNTHAVINMYYSSIRSLNCRNSIADKGSFRCLLKWRWIDKTFSRYGSRETQSRTELLPVALGLNSHQTLWGSASCITLCALVHQLSPSDSLGKLTYRGRLSGSSREQLKLVILLVKPNNSSGIKAYRCCMAMSGSKKEIEYHYKTDGNVESRIVSSEPGQTWGLLSFENTCLKASTLKYFSRPWHTMKSRYEELHLGGTAI